jgi:hypothetical protein
VASFAGQHRSLDRTEARPLRRWRVMQVTAQNAAAGRLLARARQQDTTTSVVATNRAPASFSSPGAAMPGPAHSPKEIRRISSA